MVMLFFFFLFFSFFFAKGVMIVPDYADVSSKFTCLPVGTGSRHHAIIEKGVLSTFRALRIKDSISNIPSSNLCQMYPPNRLRRVL